MTTDDKCPKCGADLDGPESHDWAIFDCGTVVDYRGVTEADTCLRRQIAALKAELAEAREKMGQVSEALTPYLLRFDITNTRCSDAIPRVLAEVRRAGLEEALTECERCRELLWEFKPASAATRGAAARAAAYAAADAAYTATYAIEVIIANICRLKGEQGAAT